MSKVIVLGAGMVGSAMAIDLAKKHEVTLTDLSKDRLDVIKLKCPSMIMQSLDVTRTEVLTSALVGFDLVICAVPGFLGYNTLKTIIEANKDVVDISFFPEDALALNQLAKECGVTAIVDCGVAPGLHNIILGHYNELMKITDYECLVGGLPKAKKWPFYYKAPFSPIDVIEEYTRPSRYVENGIMVTRDPLTDCNYVEFDKIGTLQSFNTDGLRSLMFTMPHIPNMIEKTLRYPGHVDAVLMLKQSGFFSTQKIKVHDQEVTPLDVTSRILFGEWKLEDEEEELTIMRITITGVDNNGEGKTVVCQLHDEYDHDTKTSSMARTTGYTATAVANMFLDGLFSEKGVFPPELIGRHEACYDYVLEYLRERNVHCVQTV